MTNIQPTSQPIGDVMKLVMSGARRTIEHPEAASPADRILVAITLIGIAIVIGWPKGRPAPAPLVKAGQVGRQVWERRNWWL